MFNQILILYILKSNQIHKGIIFDLIKTIKQLKKKVIMTTFTTYYKLLFQYISKRVSNQTDAGELKMNYATVLATFYI
jgi:hypothetical protein